MSEADKLITTIFGGIIAIAAISVIVGRQSKAPAAISAIGGAMSSIVAAAVNPANNAGNLGNNGNNSFSASSGPFSSSIAKGVEKGLGVNPFSLIQGN